MLSPALPEFGITHVLPPEPLDALWRRFVFEWALSDYPEETHMADAAAIIPGAGKFEVTICDLK